MKPTTKVAIAGLLSAAGAVLSALAAEYSGATCPETVAPVAPDPAKPKKTPKAEKPAEKPADPEPEPETPAAPEDKQEGGKSYEELRASIEPLVKAGQGEDVKKVIAKYGVNLREIATKPGTHAAFEKDLAALSY